MDRRNAGWWLGLIGALAMPGLVYAQDAPPPEASTLETARGVALGAGARASALSSSAVAYNPAAMPAAQLYHVETLVGYDGGQNTWSLGTAAVDSVTNKLAAGFSFRYVLGGGDDAYNGYDGRFGLGLPLSDRISIGLSGRYLRLRADQHAVGAENQNTRDFTLDAAVRVNPTGRFEISALGYNLIDTGSSLAPTLVGGALSLGIGDAFLVAGDMLVDLTTFEDPEFIAGGGLEFMTGEAIPIRLGYRFDSGRDTHEITGGLGYVDQKVGADISLRQGVSGNTDTQLVLSFRYHVQ